MKQSIRYVFDLIRWRFVAAFYIAWWFARGAPKKHMVGLNRWDTAKLAWSLWRSAIMFRHEHEKYISLHENMTKTHRD